MYRLFVCWVNLEGQLELSWCLWHWATKLKHLQACIVVLTGTSNPEEIPTVPGELLWFPSLLYMTSLSFLVK